MNCSATHPARRPIRSLGIAAGLLLALCTASAFAQTDETVTFRWREPVRCGPDGTLRFDAGARLDLIDSQEGSFELRGKAREEALQRGTYAITLVFIDWEDRELFRIASEPFEMDPEQLTDFLVFGSEPLIAQYWDEIAAVDLDTQVPFEPLFEEAVEFYGGVLQYRREQDLEARIFP